MSLVTLNKILTLRDVAELAAADDIHRYELSPEGVLTVVPPADFEHSSIAGLLVAWLTNNGYRGRVGPDAGVAVAERSGGRVADIIVSTSDAPKTSVYLDAKYVRLVIEIVSPGSEDMDNDTKPREYAQEGIPYFWRVERHTSPPMIYLHQLLGTAYTRQRVCTLDELLAGQAPALD